MKSTLLTSRTKAAGRVVVLLIAIGLLGAVPLLSRGHTSMAINITVNNNAQREVRRLYLAPADPNNWGPDQLNGSTISSGSSFTLNNIACDGSNIRLIAEDQNGCFLYQTVSCVSDTSWTITNDATPDCGN